MHSRFGRVASNNAAFCSDPILATEMLTNEGNEEFDKQDCELKAFPRLVAKLRKLFPRTPLCLLLDGLYANQNVIRLIEQNFWKYIITFKEGSMAVCPSKLVADRNQISQASPAYTPARPRKPAPPDS